MPLEDVEVHGKIYRLAEYFSDNDPTKAKEFKTAILDKRHPYLKKYLTNFKDAFGLEFGYKKDSGDFLRYCIKKVVLPTPLAPTIPIIL